MSWNIAKPGDYLNGPLIVADTSLYAPSLTWNQPAAAIIRSENGQVAVGSDNAAPYGLWMQVRNLSNQARDFLLNPLGGNVGIAQRNPSAWLINGLGIGSGSGDWGATIYTGTANTGYLCFADGTTTTDRYRGYLAYLHATDALAFGVNATEGMRLNSTGLAVGGVPSGGMLMTVGNTSSVSATANAYQILTNKAVFNITSDGATNAAGTTISYSWANGGQGSLIVTRAAGEVARFNPNGTFILGGGNTAADGRGIAFPVTQSASTDANTLDDYEEGTWTPSIAGATTAGTATYSFQGGRYTKIGNRVFVDGYISWSSHTGTGDMLISGLPFNVSSVAFYSSGCIGDVNAISINASNTLTLTAVTNASQILFRQLPVGGGSSSTVPVDAQANISFSLCYIV